MSVKQSISRDEEWTALACAIRRITEIKGNPDHGSRYDKKLSWFDYVAQIAESIGAEIAVAKWLGIESFNPNDSHFKKTADVGSHFEVKWTRWDSGAMIIYDNDRNQDIAILCTGKSPDYLIRGWLPVAMAKDKKWRRSDQPTFWVDQYNLHPMENLLRSDHGKAAIHLPR